MINSAYFSFDEKLYIWPLGRIQSLRHDLAEIHTDSTFTGQDGQCIEYQSEEIITGMFVLKKTEDMLTLPGISMFAILQDAGRAKILLIYVSPDSGQVDRVEDTRLSFSTEKVASFAIQ